MAEPRLVFESHPVELEFVANQNYKLPDHLSDRYEEVKTVVDIVAQTIAYEISDDLD